MKKLLVILSVLFIFSITIHVKAQPAISAESAILTNADTGKALYSKNPDTKRPIASITKLMTAIIAIEDGKLDSRVVISKAAASQPPRTAGLHEGDILTLRQLLYAAMMVSGNDAAYAIAEHIAGNVPNFVKLMNRKAKSLGMNSTTFHSPSGLPEPSENISTASDMAKLMRYDIQNPTLREIIHTKEYRTISMTGIPYEWTNENKLVQNYDWIIGGKTGFTKAAGRTLVSAGKKGDITLIVVTLNDPNDWQDHYELYKWGFNKFGQTV